MLYRLLPRGRQRNARWDLSQQRLLRSPQPSSHGGDLNLVLLLLHFHKSFEFRYLRFSVSKLVKLCASESLGWFSQNADFKAPSHTFWFSCTGCCPRSRTSNKLSGSPDPESPGTTSERPWARLFSVWDTEARPHSCCLPSRPPWRRPGLLNPWCLPHKTVRSSKKGQVGKGIKSVPASGSGTPSAKMGCALSSHDRLPLLVQLCPHSLPPPILSNRYKIHPGTLCFLPSHSFYFLNNCFHVWGCSPRTGLTLTPATPAPISGPGPWRALRKDVLNWMNTSAFYSMNFLLLYVYIDFLEVITFSIILVFSNLVFQQVWL